MTIEYSTLTNYDILEFMVRHDPVLDLAYDLKYELDEFYSRSNEKNALKNIEELIISFRNSQIKEMMDFGNTLVKWKYEIVNSFVSRQESCTVSIKTQHITCIQSKTRGILQNDDKKKDLYTDCGQS